jgi:predicted nucleic acid-binding protein
MPSARSGRSGCSAEAVLYLDSSAIVKLVVSEPQTAALVETVRSDPEMVSSTIARIEVLRAVKRAGARRAVAERAESILGRMGLVRLEEEIVKTASELRPRELRTLEAIHVATALSLVPAISSLITYDARLASAARATGLTALGPA